MSSRWVVAALVVATGGQQPATAQPLEPISYCWTPGSAVPPNGAKSFDDVMRLAYQRFGGERGFTPDDFRMTAETMADVSLAAWFKSAVSSTDELDYSDLLEWYGLRFVASWGPIAGNWALERRPDQTAIQRQRLSAWLGRR